MDWQNILAGVKSYKYLSQRLLQNTDIKIVRLHLQMFPEGSSSWFWPLCRSIYTNKAHCKEVWATGKVDNVGYNISNQKSILTVLRNAQAYTEQQ